MGHSKNRGSKRNILIRKENGGYGLTLIGDHPVTVQSVDPGSPAFAAGIGGGDVIVKVNGFNVWEFPHAEVVLMIKNGLYVTLTVQSPDLIKKSTSAKHRWYKTHSK